MPEHIVLYNSIRRITCPKAETATNEMNLWIFVQIIAILNISAILNFYEKKFLSKMTN
jgi:hypothetical protein